MAAKKKAAVLKPGVARAGLQRETMADRVAELKKAVAADYTRPPVPYIAERLAELMEELDTEECKLQTQSGEAAVEYILSLGSIPGGSDLNRNEAMRCLGEHKALRRVINAVHSIHLAALPPVGEPPPETDSEA